MTGYEIQMWFQNHQAETMLLVLIAISIAVLVTSICTSEPPTLTDSLSEIDLPDVGETYGVDLSNVDVQHLLSESETFAARSRIFMRLAEAKGNSVSFSEACTIVGIYDEWVLQQQ